MTSMLLYCNSHSAMFSPTSRHATQSASFNPYNYATTCPTQAQSHYSGTQMTNTDFGTQDQSFQQGGMSWHPTPVYPVPGATCGKPAPYDDWGQAQGSPLSASPCSHITSNNQTPLSLVPTTNQSFGYGQTYQQYRQISNTPSPEYVTMPGHVAIPDVHHLSPDTTLTASSDPDSPGVISSITSATVRPQPARSPFEWMKRQSYQNQQNPGKTRTKDKYRVVYTDHQRLELEKEYHYSHYITIRRKSELASSLGLSERQVKIWFQNRRAKERKQAKKQEEIIQKEKEQVRQRLHAANSLASIGKPLLSLDAGPCS